MGTLYKNLFAEGVQIIRRYETDLEASVGNTNDNKFFEQIRSEFPNSTFKISKSINAIIVNIEKR